MDGDLSISKEIHDDSFDKDFGQIFLIRNKKTKDYLKNKKI